MIDPESEFRDAYRDPPATLGEKASEFVSGLVVVVLVVVVYAAIYGASKVGERLP